MLMVIFDAAQQLAQAVAQNGNDTGFT